MVNRDILFMTRALALAERGRGRTTPNPMVGAVVVDSEGVVVGRGFHQVAGGAHAEINALADAGERSRGATLYCTLEPCTHVGRTGPCAPKVAGAGIRRAVIGTVDPNPLVAGRGIAHLREHGIDVTVGVSAEDARRINAPFFTRMQLGRPFVTVKAALTLDGCVAAAPGQRTQLTSAPANRAIHRERAEIDGIAVGSGTILTDDPLLTARGAYRYRPLTRVVFDRRLRTPAGARLLSTTGAGPVIIVCASEAARAMPDRVEALAARGARIEGIATDGAQWLAAALARLVESDCQSLVVEGGPTLQEAFWRAGLVDRVQLFVTPHVAGKDGVPWAALPIGTIAGLDRSTSRPIGDDILIEGYVHRTD